MLNRLTLPFSRRTTVIAVTVLALLVGTISMASASNQQVTLTPPDGALFEDAAGHALLVGYYDQQANPNFEPGYQMIVTINDLPCPNRWLNQETAADMMYTLWATTDTEGRVRLRNFNTSCDNGSARVWYLTGPGQSRLQTMFVEDLLIEVTVELDEGEGWPSGVTVLEAFVDRP